jgi:hypothetical protein
MATSTLMVHRGERNISREELASFEAPPPVALRVGQQLTDISAENIIRLLA